MRNAERVIREALQADSFLKTFDPAPRVFVQGSYKANTNVRADSDVDICILLPETYFWSIQFSDIKADQSARNKAPRSIQGVQECRLKRPSSIGSVGQA